MHTHESRGDREALFLGSNDIFFFFFAPVCIWQRCLLCVYGCNNAKQLSQGKQGWRMAGCCSNAVKYSHLRVNLFMHVFKQKGDAYPPHLSSHVFHSNMHANVLYIILKSACLCRQCGRQPVHLFGI